MLEALRPDPTFYPSARIAMEAPSERLAYTVLLSPDHSKPDALAVIDVDKRSANFGKITGSTCRIAATSSIISVGTPALPRSPRFRTIPFSSDAI